MEESDAEGEGEAEDGMGEAQMLWRDMGVREYGCGGEGSIGRVRFSTDVNENGGAGGEGSGSSVGSKILVNLRDVRKTNIMPYRVRHVR